MSIRAICKLLMFQAALRRAMLLAAMLLVVLLPPLAVGSAWVGFTGLAAIPHPAPDDLGALLENLGGGKSIFQGLLWFAGLAVTSWTFFARWILKQLDDQRKVNADLITKLLGYMQDDHTDGRVLMTETRDVMREVRDHLKHSRA